MPRPLHSTTPSGTRSRTLSTPAERVWTTSNERMRGRTSPTAGPIWYGVT